MADKLIYFLCTGNSSRSQMAEGWAEKYLSNEWEVKSAGLETHGLNPFAVKAMQEAGVDISDQTSDLIDLNLLERSTWVVTLCGDARDNCPTLPPHVKKDHWGFEDPAKAEGTDEEKLAVFRQVRGQIEERIKEFAETGH